MNWLAANRLFRNGAILAVSLILFIGSLYGYMVLDGFTHALYQYIDVWLGSVVLGGALGGMFYFLLVWATTGLIKLLLIAGEALCHACEILLKHSPENIP